MNITDIFFDLDGTLWDFKTNARIALRELFYDYELNELGIESFEIFLSVYMKHNTRLWKDYGEGIITQEQLRVERFRKTFHELEVEDGEISEQIAEDYLKIVPRKENLVEGAKEILEHYHAKKKLHIITNGFHDVQFIKIQSSGIEKYFDTITTSEMAGCQKPDVNIFLFAMNTANVNKPENAVMIGDHPEVDILGAKRAGMKQIFINSALTADGHENISDGLPEDCKADFEIKKLLEIKNIIA